MENSIFVGKKENKPSPARSRQHSWSRFYFSQQCFLDLFLRGAKKAPHWTCGRKLCFLFHFYISHSEPRMALFFCLFAARFRRKQERLFFAVCAFFWNWSLRLKSLIERTTRKAEKQSQCTFDRSISQNIVIIKSWYHIVSLNYSKVKK